MTRVAFADSEGDGFLENLSRLWTIQFAPDADTPVEVFTDVPFREYECLGIDPLPPLKEGLRLLSECDRVVFHSGLRYDYWAINKLYPGTLRREQVIDSVVLARLMDAESKRHNLAELGELLGYKKITHEWDFKTFNPEMIPYGRRDVEILQRAWKGEPGKLYPFGTFYNKFLRAVDLELHTQFVIAKQEQHGFRFDSENALILEGDLREEKRKIELETREIFPPIVTPRYSEKQVDKITGLPKRLKDDVEVFNPNSRDQIAKRLIDKYGWEPTDETETGKVKVDEDVLAKLPYPEAQLLARSMRLTKQLGMLSDGDNAWLKLVTPEGYIHGAVNTIGARTHRMSHSKPNMAQVDKEPRMRALWLADPDMVMVGIDAEGLELRMLAHYLARYDGGKYGEYVHSGDKKLGTDVHTINQKLIGLQDRDFAKTIIYALLYGAGNAKLGSVFVDDLRAAGMEVPKKSLAKIGKDVREALEEGIVGYKQLTQTCKDFHKRRGHMPGLDGRWIKSASDYSALNTLLQGNGAIVMKQALVHFDQMTLCLQNDMKYLANVHDEFQVSVIPSLASEVAFLGKKAIADAGVTLGVRCPLVGDAKIGANWYETH